MFVKQLAGQVRIVCNHQLGQPLRTLVVRILVPEGTVDLATTEATTIRSAT
jgi:hypothetical protein